MSLCITLYLALWPATECLLAVPGGKIFLDMLNEAYQWCLFFKGPEVHIVIYKCVPKQRSCPCKHLMHKKNPLTLWTN